MNQFTAQDPMNSFAIIVLRILMIFSAVMVTVGGFMIYHAFMGTMNVWDLSVQTDFIEYFPAYGNSFWVGLLFAGPTFGFLAGFIFFAWLEKRIRIEI